jgi:D-amino-acid dehydrogenase
MPAITAPPSTGPACGLTPSNVPYIGATRYRQLFLNTGHGTGWTMGCGAGRALADLVSGRRPDVEFAFCGQRLAPQSAAAAFRVRPAGGICPQWGAFRSRKD